MPITPRPFPPAAPHGDLAEVLPGVHFVTGTVGVPGPLRTRFSRNMTVFVEGDGRVVLVNTVRLSEDGLKALDALGKVTDVVRLAGAHGMDDPFYKDRYGAKVWAVKGQRYTAGFDGNSEPYLEADVAMEAGGELPLAGARLHVIRSRPAEGVLVADRHGGVAVSGDALQNWATTDRFFNFTGKMMLPLFGFVKPKNVGPAWFKFTKPPVEDLRSLLDLGFENVLPAHGTPVIGGAAAGYRPAVDRLK